MTTLFGKLAREERGAVVIETAFVVPILALLALGAFDASNMFSRQVELQTALAEASQIAVSAPPANATDRSTLQSIIMASTGITDASKVTVTPKYRCGTEATMVDAATSCTTTYYASFVQITVQATYSPLWTTFGIPYSVNYNLQRTIQVG